MTKFLDFHKFHKNLLKSSWNFLTFLINFIWKPSFISFNQGLVWIHFRRQYDNTLKVWRLLWYIVVTCNILQFPSQSSHCEADIYGRYFMSWHDTSRHNAHFSLIRICQIQPLAQSSLLKTSQAKPSLFFISLMLIYTFMWYQFLESFTMKGYHPIYN